MDWLKNFNASIDIAHSKLFLWDRTFSTDLQPPTHMGLAHTKQTFIIPLNCEAIFPVHINKISGLSVVLEGRECLPNDKFPLMIAKSLVNINNGVIKVMNYTDQS